MSPLTTMAWLSPDRTVTACWWATRTAWFQAAANCGLATSWLDLVVHETGDPGGEGGGQVVEPLDEFGSRALSGQCVDGLVGEVLDVDVLEDRGGDPVGDRLLYCGVGDQWCGRGDEAVGVGDLVVGPHGDQGEGREQASQDEQDGGDHRAPADASTRRAPAGAQCQVLLPQSFELGALVIDQAVASGRTQSRGLAPGTSPDLLLVHGYEQRGTTGCYCLAIAMRRRSSGSMKWS